MKRKRYTEAQRGFALQQAEAGTQVGEVCRKLGVAEATSYRWAKSLPRWTSASSASWYRGEIVRQQQHRALRRRQAWKN